MSIKQAYNTLLDMFCEWAEKKTKWLESDTKFHKICDIERESIEGIEDVIEHYPIGWQQALEIIRLAAPSYVDKKR